MKIVLDNRTQYRDEDLRAIVRGACRAAGVAAKEVRLTVVNARLIGRISGRASLPSRRSALIWGSMRLRLPKGATVQRIAQVALHEAMHLAGVAHRDMTKEQFECKMPVPWATELQLREREALSYEELTPHRRQARLEHAQRMFAKAETRVKRAQTIAKKWRRRLVAAESAIAAPVAAGTQKPKPSVSQRRLSSGKIRVRVRAPQGEP